MKAIFLALIALLLSCGTPPCNCRASVYGVCLDTPWAETPDTVVLKDALEASAAFWGTAPDAMSGWCVVVREDLIDCQSDGRADAGGCTRWEEGVVEVVARDGACPLRALWHEF